MLRTKRTVTVSLTLLAAGLLAVGCSKGGDDDDVASVNGDDQNESADSSSDKEAQEKELYDWVACMQDAGIDISDPVRNSNGDLEITDGPMQMGSSSGDNGPSTNEDQPDPEEPEIDPQEMEAAQEECGDPPMMGSINEDISDEDRERMEQAAMDFSECMRENGIEDFPDPDFSSNGPGGAPQTQQGGPASEGDGGTPGDGAPSNKVMGPWGEIDLSDPETKAAFDACESVMQAGAPDAPGNDSGDA
jgi:hypothetical protein